MSLVDGTDQVGPSSALDDGLSNRNTEEINIAAAATTSTVDETTSTRQEETNSSEQTTTSTGSASTDNQQSSLTNNIKPSTSSSLRPRTLSQTLRELGKNASVVENCPICLLQITDNTRSYAGSCFHSFCYECLLEWSKIKANCPLCKKEFQKIIYDIKSMTDYKEHTIKPPENRSFYTIFTYNNNNNWTDAPVSLGDFIDRLAAGRTDRAENNFRHDLTNIVNRIYIRSPYSWRAGVETAPVTFRRLVYMYRWTASETEIETRRENREVPANGAFVFFNTNTTETTVTQINQFRDTRPSFFLRNPAITHRLHQFLHRELKTLAELTNSNDLRHESDILVGHIINIIKLHDINSEDFLNRILRYIRNVEFARRFQHEFYVYARSTSPNLIDYDMKCVYYNDDNRRVDLNIYKKYDNPVQISTPNTTLDNRIIIQLTDDDNNTDNANNVNINRAASNNNHQDTSTNTNTWPEVSTATTQDEDSEDDIIVLRTTTTTTTTTTNEAANSQENYIYSDLEGDDDDVNDFFNDRLFADDDTSNGDSSIDSERLLNVNESTTSPRRSHENTTLNDDDDDGQSSYCEEVDVTPMSSPTYIVLSSDDDDSERENRSHSNQEQEQINNSKMPKTKFACKRRHSSSSSSSSTSSSCGKDILIKYDSDSKNTDATDHDDDDDNGDRPTTSKKAMKKSKKHHKSKKSKKHKKKSHKSKKSKKRSRSLSSTSST